MARRSKTKSAAAPQKQIPGSTPAVEISSPPPPALPSPSGSTSSNPLSSSPSSSSSNAGTANANANLSLAWPVEDTFFSVCMNAIDMLRANNSSKEENAWFRYQCRHCGQYFKDCMVMDKNDEVIDCRACNYIRYPLDDKHTDGEKRHRDNNCQLQLHLNCNSQYKSCLKKGQTDLAHLRREVRRIGREVERDVREGRKEIVYPGEDGVELDNGIGWGPDDVEDDW